MAEWRGCVLRPDPCDKCKLPVFMAERLDIDEKIFHRTCLKCSRCGSQLSPGSFYESDLSNEFCCESCVDDETIATRSSGVALRNKESKAPTKTVRSSIAERLAFFEKGGHNNDSLNDGHKRSSKEIKFLQKSLSDEEKSQSLKRLENNATDQDAEVANIVNNLSEVTNENDRTQTSQQNLQQNEEESDDDDDDDDSESDEDDEDDDSDASDIVMIGEESPSKSLSQTQQHIKSQENLEKEFSDIHITTKDTQIKITSTKNEIELKTNDLTNNNGNDKDEPLPTEKNEILQKQTIIQTPNLTVDNPLDMNSNDKEELPLNLEQKADKDSELATNASIKEINETNIEILNVNIEQIPNGTDVANDYDVVDQKATQSENILETLEVSETSQQNDLKDEKTEIDEPDISVESNNLNSLDKVPIKLQIENVDNVDTINDKSVVVNDNVKLNENDNLKPSVQTERHDEQEDDKIVKELNEEQVENIVVVKTPNKTNDLQQYPEELNPFQSDDDDDDDDNDVEKKTTTEFFTPKKIVEKNLNPFDSSDDEIELEKLKNSTSKVPPPRPPPPRIIRNPFEEDADGSDDNVADVSIMSNEDSEKFSRRSSSTSSISKKTPVPTPRTNMSISQSLTPTPEPTPRLGAKNITLNSSNDLYGSVNSLTSPQVLQRNSNVRGSSNSLTSSAGGTVRSRKQRRAPAPPQATPSVRELFASNEAVNSSKTSTPSSSTVGTPKSGRKKRPAPPPPKPARLDPDLVPQQINIEYSEDGDVLLKSSNTYTPHAEADSKLSDEEKVLLNTKQIKSSIEETYTDIEKVEDDDLDADTKRNSRRLIPLDARILQDDLEGVSNETENIAGECDDLKHKQLQRRLVDEEETNIVYRRILIPKFIDETPRDVQFEIEDVEHNRQLEKLKDNKEAQNRNRQSQVLVNSKNEDVAEQTTMLFNKSLHAKWKKRKGPAPTLPVPPRRVLQKLPLQEIRQELDIIEVQQQGLEKQGVILEKMIRDRCEGQNGELIGGIRTTSNDNVDSNGLAISSTSVENSKEVEDLILQLFELVNEKNELFRRQAELMYLRRQHRLEQEQADIEYEIRILMAQPERNKTDSDKAREETLIARLVEVVQLRNEVIECLEMDRLRETEEDLSIKNRLEMHTSKREHDVDSLKKSSAAKLSKKEKKKQKEMKKLSKSKKLDADKDADETELNAEKRKNKNKKRKFLFLGSSGSK